MDRLFIVVSKGVNPASATPILVTENEDLCTEIAGLIARALQPSELPRDLRVLREPIETSGRSR